jgi:hypothetical protein
VILSDWNTRTSADDVGTLHTPIDVGAADAVSTGAHAGLLCTAT